MENLTHTLAGAAIGEAFFRKTLGRRAVVASALAANLPDIDVAFLLLQDPGTVLLRRGLGHSLFLLPLWAAGLTWLLKRRWPESKTEDLAACVAVNAGVHLLLDFINSFGVMFLWPLSIARWELGITFIVDFALTAFVAAPHLARLSAKRQSALPRAARAGLAAAAAYLLASFGLRERAVALHAAAAPNADFRYVFPEPFGPHRWRGAAKSADGWDVSLIRPLSGTVEIKARLPNAERDEAVRIAAESSFGRRLLTFFKAPVWELERQPDGWRVARVRDLRFATLAVPRATPFEFAILVSPDGRAAPRDARIW